MVNCASEIEVKAEDKAEAASETGVKAEDKAEAKSTDEAEGQYLRNNNYYGGNSYNRHGGNGYNRHGGNGNAVYIPGSPGNILIPGAGPYGAGIQYVAPGK